MSSFEEIREKASEIAGEVADKSLIFAKKAADKTRAVAKITKLSAEIAAEKSRVKKNYAEIGRLYYEKYKDEPEENVAQAVSEISISMEIIESKRADIEEIKSAGDVKDEDVEECCCEEPCEESCSCEDEKPFGGDDAE